MEQTVGLLGIRFGLSVTDPGFLASLADHLPPDAGPAGGAESEIVRRCAVDGPRGDPPVWTVRCGRRRPRQLPTRGEAAAFLAADLERTVARQIPDRLLLHAGVVAVDGGALLLPGRTGSGKSRLVEAMLRLGATYLSDELAVLDRRGRVHPFARPLCLRTSSVASLRLSAADLGAPTAASSLPVRQIVLLRHRTGATGCRLHAVPPGEAMLALLRQTLAARRRLALAREVLEPLVRSVPVLQGVRGEALDAAEHLLETARQS